MSWFYVIFDFIYSTFQWYEWYPNNIYCYHYELWPIVVVLCLDIFHINVIPLKISEKLLQLSASLFKTEHKVYKENNLCTCATFFVCKNRFHQCWISTIWTILSLLCLLPASHRFLASPILCFSKPLIGFHWTNWCYIPEDRTLQHWTLNCWLKYTG
jgi:hypothetical protein